MKNRLDKDEEFLKTRHVERDRIFHELKNEKKILENNLYELTQFNMKLQYNLNQAKEISK